METNLKSLFRTILLLAACMWIKSIFAQAPEKMSFQTVVRDNSNKLVASKPVGLQISILQGSATGTVVHTETMVVTTNANGLISTEVSISGIDWANGPYFIKTESDLSGGTNYSISGTTELLSVPYALYANNSGEAPGNATGDMKYWDGTNWVLLPAGQADQVLTVTSSHIPQWKTETPTAGKSYIVIEGDVTDAQAAAQVSNEFGISTQFIWIQNTTALTSLDLSMISQLIQLKIKNNKYLANINFDGLTNVSGDVDIQLNPALSSLSFPLLKRISDFQCYNTALTSLSLPALASGATISIAYTNLEMLNFPALIKVMDFGSYDNPNLTSLSLPVCNWANSFTLNGSPLLSSVALPALVTCDQFDIASSSVLSTLSLPLLQTSSNFTCGGNTSLTALSLPLLQTNTNFTCVGNTILTTLSLPLLQTNSGFSCSDNTSLTTLSLPLLQTNASFNCAGNTSLANLSLPALTTVGEIVIGNNNELTTFSGPLLASVSRLEFNFNSKLANINLPALSIFNGISFSAIYDALSSSQINALLAKFVSLGNTPLFYISLNGQTPPAPPTGQGIIDKATLIAAGKYVSTD
jgi:hypothetical protein